MDEDRINMVSVRDFYKKSIDHFIEEERCGRISKDARDEIILHLTAMHIAATANLTQDQLKRMLEVLG